MKNVLKPYRFFLMITLFDVLVMIFHPATGKRLFAHTYSNFAEMLGVLPPIFLLLGLLDVWVPRDVAIRYLGEGSGIVGIALSMFLGAAAAGPLYGAFPVAAVMLKKGARFSNVIIFLGAWSTLKIPMFLFEMSAFGSRFAVTRALVNIPGILIMAWIVDRFMTPEEKAEIYRRYSAVDT